MKHQVIDAPHLSTSSKVAAGLINPIVLKRLKLVAGADSYLNLALPFYRDLNGKSAREILHEIPIAHIFQTTGKLNDWNEKAANPAFKRYLGEITKNQSTSLIAPLGLGLMNDTSWVDTTALLKYHEENIPKGSGIDYIEVKPQDLSKLSEQYKHVIICNGHLLRLLLPNFDTIFTPTRGEVMVIETDGDLPADRIIHGPVFILPLGDGRYKVGATYHWDTLADQPTDDGITKLKTDLEKIYSGSYKVVRHEAGVRPNTRDRKPILGHIKDNIYCFNGLGSRGVLMAPLLAEQLLNHILLNTPLEDSVNLARFE